MTFEVFPSNAARTGLPPLSTMATEGSPRVSRGSHLRLKLIVAIVISAVGSWAAVHYKLVKIGKISEDFVQVNRNGHTQSHALRKQHMAEKAEPPAVQKKTSKKTSKKAPPKKSKRKPWLAR